MKSAPSFDGAGQLMEFVHHWGVFASNWKEGLVELEKLLNSPRVTPRFYLPGMLNFVIDFAPSNKLAYHSIKRLYPSALSYHQWLLGSFDPQETGLLWLENDSGKSYASPLVQCLWLWSTQTLVHLGGQVDTDVIGLILAQELSVFQTQDSLWSKKSQRYERVTEDQTSLTTNPAESILLLFAQLPSQETAENMLLQLQELDHKTIKPGTAMLIYHGLRSYHMERAAQDWILDWQEDHLEKLGSYPSWAKLISN